jgi:hypothetical protein
VTPPEIRVAIEELRHATRPEQRTAYERALHALADLVNQTTAAIDGVARREMTARQMHLLNDLRAAVPFNDQSMCCTTCGGPIDENEECRC